MPNLLKDVLELLDCWDDITVLDNDGRQYRPESVLGSEVLSIQPGYGRSVVCIVEV